MVGVAAAGWTAYDTYSLFWTAINYNRSGACVRYEASGSRLMRQIGSLSQGMLGADYSRTPSRVICTDRLLPALISQVEQLRGLKVLQVQIQEPPLSSELTERLHLLGGVELVLSSEGRLTRVRAEEL
ncbi:MAG: hypothetical protein AAFV43_06170 [Planctomycetota bacterium]